jgi:putative exporter of polyketide antibiotics
MGDLLSLPQGLGKFSPFTHSSPLPLPLEALDVPATVLAVTIAVFCAGAAMVLFRTRDIPA